MLRRVKKILTAENAEKSPQRTQRTNPGKSGRTHAASPTRRCYHGRVLEIRNLSVAFSAQPRSLTVVRDVSFSISPGEVLGLVGESGSGKSVTSLATMRLLRPQEIIQGEILFAPTSTSNGKPIVRPPQDLLQFDSEEMRRLR